MAPNHPRSHSILITGATDGIGFLLAKAYAGRGHQVLATGRRGIADDEAFFGMPNITYVTADQTDPGHATQTILSTLSDLGWRDLDLVILNGAMGWVGPPSEEATGKIGEQIAVNFTAPVLFAQALAPLLFSAKGRLVFVGSSAITKGRGAFATYCATKAALDGLARSLAEEWRGRAGVTILHPGPTRTGMMRKAGVEPGFMRWFFTAPKRVVKAMQVAIRRGEQRRILSRFFCFRCRFTWFREGRL